jgi:phosphohistidine phosphatase
MELILWRHAEAEDGIADMARQLTKRGEKQAEKMAAYLSSILPQDIQILVSPAKRTQQTVQALTLNYSTIPELAPGASPQSLLYAANWPDNKGCVVIVGHQPSLGELASLLMTGTSEYWSVKKGAVWWFSRRERAGTAEITLRLVIAPDLL